MMIFPFSEEEGLVFELQNRNTILCPSGAFVVKCNTPTLFAQSILPSFNEAPPDLSIYNSPGGLRPYPFPIINLCKIIPV